MHFYFKAHVGLKRCMESVMFHQIIHRRCHKIPQHRNLTNECTLHPWLNAKLIEVDWIE